MIIKKNTLSLAVILIFSVIVGAMTLRVLLHAPFWIPGDVFSHLGWAQSIVDFQEINFLSPAGGPNLYTYFPGLFVLMASGSLLTGLSVPVVAVIINVLYVMLLALGFGAVAWSVFRDGRGAVLAAIIGSTFGGSYYNISTPNEVFPFLATPNISLLFFLGAVILFVEALRRMPTVVWRQYSLAAFLTTASILIHPQSGLFRGSVFAAVCVVFIIFGRRNVKKSFGKLAMLFALPWLLVLVLNLESLKLIFNVGVNVAVNNSLDIATTATPARFSTNYGPLFTFLALLGLAFAIAKIVRRQYSYPLGFAIIFSLVTVAITYVDLLGVFFFGGRFLGELLLPYTILATFTLLSLLDMRSVTQKISATLTMAVLVFSIVSQIYILSRVQFDFDWPAVRALEWSNRHIRHAKVMADPYMSYMFYGLAHIQPAYYDLRSLAGIRNNVGVQTMMVESNAVAAYRYAKKHDIEYVIIDTYFDPYWIGATATNFQNPKWFKQVYSVRHTHTPGELIIYKVL